MYVKRQRYKQNKPIGVAWLLPILFIIGIVPLIVFARILELDGLEKEFWRGGTVHFDFFSYYKAIYFVIASYTGFFIMVALIYLRRIKLVRTKYYIPMGIYAFLAIVSVFFAADTRVALRGFIEMFQGIFVLIGYMLVMVTLINMVQTEKHVKVLMGTFIGLGLVVGALGAGQYFGYDLFRSEFGLEMIFPSDYVQALHEMEDVESITDLVNFRFGQYAIYATMANTNFVGSFAALMIPLGFAMYFYTKNFFTSTFALGFVGLMIFVGYGSNSRAGMIGVTAAFFVMLLLFTRTLIKRPWKIVIPLIMLAVVGYGLDTHSEGRVMRQIERMNLFEELRQSETHSEGTAWFEDIQIDGERIDIITDQESIRIELDGNDLTFYDLDGNELETEENTHYTFTDDTYEHYRITREDISYFRVRAYEQNIYVHITQDGFKVRGWGDTLIEPSNPPRVEALDGYESMFSSRAFIWSRSVPLLIDNFLIGAGPDMYTIEFPQDDFVGRLNGIESSIIDKPHNMFLQIGINTGTVSLIALLILFISYALQSLKLFVGRKLTTYNEFIGAGIFSSVVAYLAAGMFNDQVISVAPLFYVLLGTGIAINMMVIKRDRIYK